MFRCPTHDVTFEPRDQRPPTSAEFQKNPKYHNCHPDCPRNVDNYKDEVATEKNSSAAPASSNAFGV